MLATALRARAVDANFTVPEWGASGKTGETDMSQEVVWLLRGPGPLPVRRSLLPYGLVIGREALLRPRPPRSPDER